MHARVLEYSDKSADKRLLYTETESSGKTLGAEIEVLPILPWDEDQFAKELWKLCPEFSYGDFVLKRDGSLRAQFQDENGESFDGLEIVTGVMDVPYARQYPWETFFAGLQRITIPLAEQGIREVGLHIHAGKEWSGGVLPLIPAYLLETMPTAEISRVFGRVSPYASRHGNVQRYSTIWESLYETFTGPEALKTKPLRLMRGKELLRPLNNDLFRISSQRNSLVNVKNTDTFEFRGFLSPATAGQMRWALELVEAVMDFSAEWQKQATRKKWKMPLRIGWLPSWESFLENYPQFCFPKYQNL